MTLSQSDCSDGDLRLVGGSSSLEGRVEMCFSGVWGTVCSDLWGAADAAVVCRQLGYSSSGKSHVQTSEFTLIPLLFSGALARLNAVYGQGTDPVFLDDVKCRGLEYRLIECANRGIEVENCNHNQDAGVRCIAG